MIVAASGPGSKDDAAGPFFPGRAALLHEHNIIDLCGGFRRNA